MQTIVVVPTHPRCDFRTITTLSDRRLAQLKSRFRHGDRIFHNRCRGYFDKIVTSVLALAGKFHVKSATAMCRITDCRNNLGVTRNSYQLRRTVSYVSTPPSTLSIATPSECHFHLSQPSASYCTSRSAAILYRVQITQRSLLYVARWSRPCILVIKVLPEFIFQHCNAGDETGQHAMPNTLINKMASCPSGPSTACKPSFLVLTARFISCTLLYWPLFPETEKHLSHATVKSITLID